MKYHKRKSLNDLAHESIGNGDPTGWFERLYAQADADGNGVPWAHMKPNVRLVKWLDNHAAERQDRTTLVIGCGLGDDAYELASRGFIVTAFDVASSAITICRERFGDSNIEFDVADLLKSPQEWQQTFDFVYESITVQSLPPDYQRAAMHCIADFVAPGGEALIMTWSQPPTRLQDGPPWLLPRDALKAYEEAGLEQLDYQEELIRPSPQTWHIQAQYRRL